ncbi:hypothetical protein [Variovorax boronicumulans]|uniref:hypothetical protein n=1 Tax=Variovorax boronicumulans TaxID=436515 RepID=UPI0027846B8B|nr:hypothetical protein [Variovorax boronicumulans]MDQ0040865.1 hypothetical protein [Variovorax boronicumulans]
MTNDATHPQTGATKPPPPPRMGVITSEPMPAPRIEFDSSAMDTLTMRAAEISGLASCVVCLAAVEKCSEGRFAGYELTNDALPLLGGVIMRLAREAEQASHLLWAQYEEARALANGGEVTQ